MSRFHLDLCLLAMGEEDFREGKPPLLGSFWICWIDGFFWFCFFFLMFYTWFVLWLPFGALKAWMEYIYTLKQKDKKSGVKKLVLPPNNLDKWYYVCIMDEIGVYISWLCGILVGWMSFILVEYSPLKFVGTHLTSVNFLVWLCASYQIIVQGMTPICVCLWACQLLMSFDREIVVFFFIYLFIESDVR